MKNLARQPTSNKLPCDKGTSEASAINWHTLQVFLIVYLSVTLFSPSLGVMAFNIRHPDIAKQYAHEIKVKPSEGELKTSGTSTYFSNNQVYVVGPDYIGAYGNGLGPALPVYNQSYWVANFGGGYWIWDAYQVSNPGITQTCVFTIGIYFNFNVTITNVVLNVGVDNHLLLFVNNYFIDNCQCNNVVACDGYNAPPLTCSLTNVISGTANVVNFFEFIVTNVGSSGSNYKTNPGGLYFRIDFVYNY